MPQLCDLQFGRKDHTNYKVIGDYVLSAIFFPGWIKRFSTLYTHLWSCGHDMWIGKQTGDAQSFWASSKTRLRMSAV